MTQSESDNKLTQSVDKLLHFSATILGSTYQLRWVGYGLLVLAIFDTIQLFIPPQVGNPIWVLQTMGALVERVAVPLLGIALIFFGEDSHRKSLEKGVLKLLSWMCLLLAVLFLLLIPLGIGFTWRVNGLNNDQITAQATQQTSVLQQVEDQVSKGSNQDIQNLGTQLSSLGISVNAQKPEELKSEILKRVTLAKDLVKTQSATAVSNQRISLLKNSVKWILGALVSSVLFLRLWGNTSWTRRHKS